MKRNRNPKYLKQYRDNAGNWINQYRRNGRVIRLPNGRDFTDQFWAAYYQAEADLLAGRVAAKSPAPPPDDPIARRIAEWKNKTGVPADERNPDRS